MVQSVISSNYSGENIFGWIAGQSATLPLYSELLQITQLPLLEQRYQALKRWPLFVKADSDTTGWTTEILEHEYNELQISLATRYGVTHNSYLVDYVWIQRWMPLVRQIARNTFLGKSVQSGSDREVLVVLFSNILANVDMPSDIQSHFLLSFEEILKKPITLFEIESALDKVSMHIQMEHYAATRSKGVKEWILLQLLLEWSRQYVRHVQLELPVPIWEEWFSDESVAGEFSSFNQVQELFFQKVDAGSEWVIPVDMFEESVLLTIDPVVFETRLKQIQASFLNQSVYTTDVMFEVVRFAFRLKQIIETAAIVVAKNLPTAQAVQTITANYDI